jgi:hypothetical protein
MPERRRVRLFRNGRNQAMLDTGIVYGLIRNPQGTAARRRAPARLTGPGK